MMGGGAMKGRWLWIGIGALAVLYCMNWLFTPEIVGIVKLEEFYRPKGRLKFDPEKWCAPSYFGQRYEMVDDLLQRCLPLGLSREEVESLLGPPHLVQLLEEDTLVWYELGWRRDYPSRSIFFPGRLINVETWLLELRFRDGRLYAARVTES